MTLFVRIALISLLVVVMSGYGQATEGASADENASVDQENEGLSFVNSLVKESEWESSDFVTESAWKGVKCSKTPDSFRFKEGTSTHKCTFPNANLQQVYNIMTNKSFISEWSYEYYLRKELPAKNMKFESRDFAVIYTYKKPQHLHIEIVGECGGADIEIIENEDETRYITSHYDC